MDPGGPPGLRAEGRGAGGPRRGRRAAASRAAGPGPGSARRRAGRGPACAPPAEVPPRRWCCGAGTSPGFAFPPRGAGRSHGSSLRPARGPARGPGVAAAGAGGPLGRGLVVGPAGAPRLRVPPYAGGQHAARPARPRAGPCAPARRAPRSPGPAAPAPAPAPAAPARVPARAGPGRGLGRPPSPGSPGAHFRAAGGRRRAHAVPRQGRARLPPVAPSRLPARALAHRHPVAPPGWPRLQKPCRGREEAPGLPGVAPAQSVLAAAAADPPPLEVSGTLRAEGEPHSVHLGLASASKEWPPNCSTGRPACSWGFPALPSPPSREVPELVSECCPRLTFLKLSDCHNVPADALIMLARACSRLHSLDLQHSMVDSTAVVSFLEEMGPRMLKLWITYSSQTTAILGALLGSRCPRLQVLEVSTGINPSRTPLQLPVEALQRGCPQLQVLRLLNLIWMPKPSGRGVAPGPGFPHLEELCLAGSTCTFVNNEVLGRLLHGSPNLRLLDLRGCDRITPTGLHDLPCQELEQLHLGLFGMSDRLTLAKEGSPLLTQKWYHSLRELDLSGQGFSEKDLEQALAAFSGCPVPPALRVLNLRGTRVTPGVVSSVISSCPGLLYLNLESCRCLPRGLKRVYRGLEEVQRCLEQLCTSPSPPASLA